ncbi:MerR family transcriptional regulator [Kutzneria viridogrisea]|uniref:DNA-binding transcriptional MerR regulator n=1 Tax=Kutzneria viridogrisea TaxID=47990 RepID=A0ABR6BC94_9PSEU|nr:DNA-binding transcriptional MerR regulator [Kutzneria viridogrisea]
MTGPAVWTPGALARSLGISPTTLRTWDRRYGLGPSARQDGRHRRYTDQDAARLRRMVELTAMGMAPASAAALALGQPPRDGDVGPAAVIGPHAAAVRGFARAATRLDEPLLRGLSQDLISEYGVVTAWEQVFMPALIQIGDRVADRSSGIEVEHIASATVGHALRQVPTPEHRGRLPVLLACAPEELHTLALDALGAALSERDCAHRALGARVPPRALLDAVGKLRPAVVVVWAHREDLARSVPLAALVAEPGVAVVVAGPGWSQVGTPQPVRAVRTLPGAVRTVLELIGRSWDRAHG